MWKRINQIISGKDCELKERMFRTIILAGGVATVLGIVECLFVIDLDNILFLMMILLLLGMIAAFIATFKYQKYDLAAMLLGLVLLLVFFPVTFIWNGGIDGGSPVWFALVILYIFIMFSGKRQVFFWCLSFAVIGGTYLLTYYYPELLQPLEDEKAVYIDSFFAVIVVGNMAGMILKAHMKVFEEEHQLNLRQKEELEKSRDAKNVLFANMSHEIRTPINAIIGLNEMILRENASEEIREYAKDIQTASKMLLNQVNDILDLSQMEMGKMSIVPMQYQTKELFLSLAELTRFQMEKKGLDFYLDIDRNLPSALVGDEKRIKQVLLNILDNAVKYTETGSVILSAHGEDCEDGTINLKIKVADTGIGIRKEDLEYIYDSFNRFDEKKNSTIVGSGLGLAITKQLVDLMGGDITVDSIYRKGSVFTIILKQIIVDREPMGIVELGKGAIEEDVYRPSFEAPDARILVVDDNRTNSMVAAKLLSSTKVQVDIANSGKECIEMANKKYYHVILLDYMMPGMNGPETLKELRRQENSLCRDTAVIALTGNAMSGARQQYAEQGFDGYVEKPIQSKLLEMEILKFMPRDVIEYLDEGKIEFENISKIQRTTMKKRKKLCITSDCVCDLPTELLEKYDIKLMYLYIKTPHGRFADTREIDFSSLTQYMFLDSASVHGDKVTVEEFEEFFADVLTQSERVLHISLASKSGRAYGTAVKAARGFDHVRVMDSGQVSCGQGLLVLYAAKLAMEGKDADEIYQAVEKMKERIKIRFIIPKVDIFYQNGYLSSAFVKICDLFQLRLYGTMRQNRPFVTGIISGSVENAWRRGIRRHLRNKRKICTDVVFITHAGCSVKQQQYIKNEVLKCVPFKRVIIQKASLSTVCVSGMGAVGISYYSL